MHEYIKCNLCGNDDYRVIYKDNLGHSDNLDSTLYLCTNPYYGRHGQIVKCRHCGLVYLNPRDKDNLIYKRYEEVQDTLYLEEKHARILTFTNSLREIEKLKPVGRILEGGCYTGFFLEVANKKGWETYGVEPSRWASSYARESLGLNVKTGNLEKADFSEKSFDVIALWDTLEHLTDPSSFLRETHRILKDDGLVCLSTINIDSLFAIVLGKYWPQLMQMHTYYYSYSTLNKLLIKAGFTVIRKHTHKRILRFRYIITRIFARRFSNLLESICDTIKIGNLPVSINCGDLITVYAIKNK